MQQAAMPHQETRLLALHQQTDVALALLVMLIIVMMIVPLLRARVAVRAILPPVRVKRFVRLLARRPDLAVPA